jgi:hypothetical protein
MCKGFDLGGYINTEVPVLVGNQQLGLATTDTGMGLVAVQPIRMDNFICALRHFNRLSAICSDQISPFP